MRVGAAREEVDPAGEQGLGEDVGVRAHLLLVGAEPLRGRDLEARRLRGDRRARAGRPAARGTWRGRSPARAPRGRGRGPARGPASVLCVVEVTTSQSSTGFGCSPAATSPAKWAMSHQSSAPTSSATRRNIAVSTVRGYAEPAAEDELRPVLACERAHLLLLDDARLARDAVVDDRVQPPGEVDLEPVRQVARRGRGAARARCRPARAARGRRPCSPARPRAAGRSRGRRRTGPSRGRSRAARSRRRTRSRRSSDARGSPPRTCSSSTEPTASRTAGHVKFSEAISSIWPRWRSASRPISAATSGSCSASPPVRRRSRWSAATATGLMLLAAAAGQRPSARLVARRDASPLHAGDGLRDVEPAVDARAVRARSAEHPVRSAVARPDEVVAGAGDDPVAPRAGSEVVGSRSAERGRRPLRGPTRTSSPPSPQITSRRRVPTSRSRPFVPTIVQRTSRPRSSRGRAAVPNDAVGPFAVPAALDARTRNA